MLKIGHRGAKGHVAENTLASFEKALEIGVDMIELDVFLSKNGIPIVIHDKTVDRTTIGSGLVFDFSAKQLKEWNVPTLEDVFLLIKNQCEINIEIKIFTAVNPVLNLINSDLFKKEKIIISSFDWNALQELRFHDNNIRLGILTETDLDLAVSFAKFIEAYSVHPYYHLLTPENTKEIQRKGFKVFPWTVNSSEDLIFVKSLQVDGIISDFPDKI